MFLEDSAPVSASCMPMMGTNDHATSGVTPFSTEGQQREYEAQFEKEVMVG
jgi:hypothetical protein